MSGALKELINQSVLALHNLKSILAAYQNSGDNSRLKITVADIDRCIEHGDYYIKDSSLYTKSNFRFHHNLISLLDTIRDNDFGINLSEEQENEKRILCEEMMKMAEAMIELNNAMQ